MLLLFDFVNRRLDPFALEIELASFGPLVGTGGEKDLQGRFGKDNTADVPAFHDTAPDESDSTLDRHQRPADARDRRYGRRHQGALRSADGFAHILAVHQNDDGLAVTLELDGMPCGQIGYLVVNRFGERAAVPGTNRQQPDRAIHGPCVEVGDLESVRQETRHS